MNPKSAAIKEEVILHYGERCACCGESHIEFLTIDHVTTSGAYERKCLKHIGGGQKFYKWLKSNNYPPGYQVLCFNCNNAKSIYKECPHKSLLTLTAAARE